MVALVVAQLLVALLLPAIAARSTRVAFVVGAVPPAAALAWVLAQAPAILRGNDLAETVAWAPRIGLEFGFRLDALGVLMAVLVSGIGVLVLVYSRWYFAPGSGDAKRSAPLLLAFAGAMLGLVLADHLITLYVFWEITTICSFLLVGQAGISRASRRAAVQALLVTTMGGLVMLVGFVVLGSAGGTYRISVLVAHPPAGAATAVAALLILVGALTKSAQVPFHNWLPAAMVAPTPISAYLHAASMVKAGVFLVARLAPVFHGVPQWWITAVVFGLITMIVAGWRALHEYDLKKLLAYGTVSQLGLIMALVGAGTYTAAIAGTTMLLAHGMFKAALFLIVGIIDHQAGTRDIRVLSGLGRRMPWLGVTATFAALSMAGLPPTIGFLGKEAAFDAFLAGEPWGVLITIGLVLGSMFTVGYTARTLWGAFATKPGLPDTVAEPAGLGLFLPAMLPVAAGIVLGASYPIVDDLTGDYASDFDPGAEPYHLAFWHGLTLPLLFSLIALAGGLVLHVLREPIIARRAHLPVLLDAQHGYERIMALLERTAVGVTGRIQVGSLPTYLGVILLTVLAVPGSALLTQTALPREVRLYDNGLQIALAVMVLIVALGVVAARRRLTAVLMVGVIGYGIGGLFIVDGAPDLALAQFLVETLLLIAFVLVLRRLPVRFTESGTARVLRAPRALIAAAGGLFISCAAVIFSAARQSPPVASQQFVARAQHGAGATNVVNAILVDFRAFDTVGEIAVLAVAATGVASLILVARFERRRRSMRSPAPSREEIT